MSNKDDIEAPFRLAMRQEGSMWNAYLAKQGTMEGALLIGSIAIAAVEDEKRQQAFVNIMGDFVADAIKEMVGVRPTRMEVQQAPEHEKAGHS